MATIRIEIETDTAAFEGDPYALRFETARILRTLADDFERAIAAFAPRENPLYASNGTPVGKVEVSE